jgi:hypothetical protein
MTDCSTQQYGWGPGDYLAAVFVLPYASIKRQPPDAGRYQS